MSATRAVVTGGGGFIGSSIVRRLLQLGYAVTVIDDFSSGRRPNLEDLRGDVELVEADIRDVRTAGSAMRNAAIVFHQAANASVPMSIDDPLGIHEVNATGTLQMLIAAKEAGVDRFVYASSTAVYGEVRDLPIPEEAPTRPMSPYGASKLGGENYCTAFHATYGTPTVALRYFNVYGPHQDPASQYAAAIPRFAQCALTGQGPTIFGDGEQTRDFVFIDDVVSANILAATVDGVEGRVFNVASGEARSINDVVRQIGDLAPSMLPPTYLPAREGEIRHSVGDGSAAARDLGFAPEVGFGVGVRRTLEWLADEAGRNEGADP